ncbi:AAA family ATPase [Pseudodesulfovibrio karagichevae]|uniref:AAA family ATPase n=1 Tax=Pseudodesulfovibrio karagichevae TaxID=3239305 RepID=A0ABV4K185_9BACT
MRNKFIVFTGGPGSGKSTVIEALGRLGHACSEEKGRKIIQEELGRSGRALPWRDKAAFRDRMLDEELRAYEHHLHCEGPVFFDRGIVDTYGYSLLEGLEITAALRSACVSHRYADRAFVFPPWKRIFTNDAERKQDFAEAQRTHAAMREAYAAFGYALTEVPCAPVEERIRFIFRELGQL